jgi:hypothetical protein
VSGTWSLDLDWDGRRWRFDDVVVDQSEDVDILAVDHGYSPRRYRIAVPMGDIAGFVALGHHPGTGRAVLSYEDRFQFDGPFSIEAGREGELSVVHLEDRPIDDTPSLPPLYDMTVNFYDEGETAAARAAWQAYRDEYWSRKSTQRWFGELGIYADPLFPGPITMMREPSPTAPVVYSERVEGLVYQLIIGQPGSDGVVASPAYLIHAANGTLQVAGHRITNGTVTIVQVWGDETATELVHTTFTSYDAEGREIAVVEISPPDGSMGAPVVQVDPGSVYFVRFDGTARGLPSDVASVIGYLIDKTPGVRVDVRALQTLRVQLRGLVLDAAIYKSTSGWQILVDELLPILPVALVPTPFGVAPVLVNLRPPREDARTHVRVGSDIVYAGDRRHFGRYDRRPVVNAWTIRFAWNARTEGFAREVTVGPSHVADAVVSVSRHGRRADVRETGWISDAPTAEALAVSLLERTALDREPLVYLARPSVFGSEGVLPLRAGEAYLWTDDEHHLDEHLVVVTSVRRQGDNLRIGVLPTDARTA